MSIISEKQLREDKSHILPLPQYLIFHHLNSNMLREVDFLDKKLLHFLISTQL